MVTRSFPQQLRNLAIALEEATTEHNMRRSVYYSADPAERITALIEMEEACVNYAAAKAAFDAELAKYMEQCRS